MRSVLKKAMSYLIVIMVALMMALNYHIFVFPNSFAPAGLNGLFTMLQYMFGFKLSFTSIIVNVPLAIVVFFTISKANALRSLTYTLAFSGFLTLFENVDLSMFIYSTTISTLLGPAVAGLISGFGGYCMFQVGACYGGTEFIAKLIHKKKPSFNFFSIIFALNVVVAIASYFVYDYNIEPVLLCIMYCYASSSVRDNMNRKNKSALRCEIITKDAEALGKEIIRSLHHSATMIPGKGLYTGEDKQVLVCVLNQSQLVELTRLVEKYPDSFVVVSHVNTVMGNFKRLDSKSLPEKELFDHGSSTNV